MTPNLGRHPLPPGPRSLPFVGNALALTRDPLRFFSRLEHHFGGLAFFQIKKRPAVLVSAPHLVSQVLADSGSFVLPPAARMLRPLFGDGLLTSEGESWLARRRVMHAGFTGARISSYVSIMNEVCEEQLEKWLAHPDRVVDMRQAFVRMTLRALGKTLLGLRDSAVSDGIADAMIDAVDELWNHRRQRRRPASAERLERALAHIRAAADSLIDAAPTTGPNTLLAALLSQAEDADGAIRDREQLRDEIVTLLVAGHETTANTLGWTLYLLQKHPAELARITDEIDTALEGRTLGRHEDLTGLTATRDVISESLRLYPPAWQIGRTAAEAVELDGFHIPAGTLVYVSSWATHRSDRVWNDPLEFRPSRFSDGAAPLKKGSYYPFGGGARQCVGSRFALVEAQVFLAALLRRATFDPVDSRPVVPNPSVTLRLGRPLPCRLQKRSK